jgi:enoyl-CoA hydratase/carnithine racemase/uncharacterized protein YqeY
VARASRRRAAGEVVILTGEGDTSFCAGFDLDALPEDSGALALPPDAPLFAATAALRRADATLIAVLHGHVFGAGVELACSCDLRIARDDARFVIPAARLGVVYHADGVALLQRCFGLALTQRLLLLGETVSADEPCAPAPSTACTARPTSRAPSWPSPTSCAPAPRRACEPTATACARSLAGHPFTAPTRAATTTPAGPPTLSDDHREGRAATRERRPPRFTGAEHFGYRRAHEHPHQRADRGQAPRSPDRPRRATKNVIGMLKSKVLNEIKSGSGAVENDELWLATITSYAKQVRKAIPEYEKAGERGLRDDRRGEASSSPSASSSCPQKLGAAATEAIVRELAAPTPSPTPR